MGPQTANKSATYASSEKEAVSECRAALDKMNNSFTEHQPITDKRLDEACEAGKAYAPYVGAVIGGAIGGLTTGGAAGAALGLAGAAIGEIGGCTFGMAASNFRELAAEKLLGRERIETVQNRMYDEVQVACNKKS